MHFHEVLEKPIENYEEQRHRLEVLFMDKPVYVADEAEVLIGRAPETLVTYLRPAFLRSRLRGTATDIGEFIASLSPHWRSSTLEGLLFYCEMLLNLLVECNSVISRNSYARSHAARIRENIDFILKNTGHKIHLRKDRFLEIVKNDVFAATVARDMTNDDAAGAIVDYTHFGIRGNLARKRELLRIIGHYVEPILQASEMKEFSGWLTKDLGCCLNSLHIRHNNKIGDKANAVAQAMSDAELEACYDGTYRELLLLIELQKNLPFHRKVKGLKEQLDAKKDGRKG